MKLKYEFEIVEMGDETVAVPVGDNAGDFQGVIQLNDVGGKMLKYLQEYDTPEEAFAKLLEEYPEEDKDEVGQKLCDFLNMLEKEHLILR